MSGERRGEGGPVGQQIELRPRASRPVVGRPCFLVRYAQIEARDQYRDRCCDESEERPVAFALHRLSLRAVDVVA
jgi:hypothetical protein